MAKSTKRRRLKTHRSTFVNAPELREVIEAKSVEGYVVEFVFDDLTRGRIDLRKYLGKGIFRILLNHKKFRNFKVDAELGTIAWPNGADIAPDTLYREIIN